jgi:hypothetical protein
MAAATTGETEMMAKRGPRRAVGVRVIPLLVALPLAGMAVGGGLHPTSVAAATAGMQSVAPYSQIAKSDKDKKDKGDDRRGHGDGGGDGSDRDPGGLIGLVHELGRVVTHVVGR